MNFKITTQNKEDNCHISVDLDVSPSDFPYNSLLREEDQKIYIELWYLNEESKKITVVDKEDSCTIKLGDNSGRIYSIIIDSDYNKSSCINNKVFRDKIKWSIRKERFRKNFLLGDNIIRETFSKFKKIKKEEYAY